MDTVGFHRVVRSWLTVVIRQRILLVSRGANRKNPALMINNTHHLQKYLDYYSYDSNKKIARFFISNKDIIHSILPGPGSSGHSKKDREFNSYLNQCNQILNDYENLHLWSHQPGAQQNTRNV